MSIRTRTDTPYRSAIGQEHGFAAVGIRLTFSDLHHDQFFSWWIVLYCEIGIASEKFGLIEFDQAIQPHFLRPVLRRVLATPAAIAFFDAQRE